MTQCTEFISAQYTISSRAAQGGGVIFLTVVIFVARVLWPVCDRGVAVAGLRPSHGGYWVLGIGYWVLGIP